MTDWDKLFEDGVGKLAPNLLQDMVRSSQPKQMGPYRLGSEIGRGGMGIVYRAQRDDGQFEQQVAIKLLPNAEPGADELRRFERERQILANLNHPHIARLYDGGIAEDGRLYLVMELVEGESLGEYLTNRQSLSGINQAKNNQTNINQTQHLKLFEQIVAAVAHAQQQLIVHCDLKPSNILVTDQAQVKLLDFGVARVLERSLAPESNEAADGQVTTNFGYQPLTPSYAAPEHLNAQPLGMYTDVYQLGLILYRLLTGQDFREASSASPVELSQEILRADQQRIEAQRGTLDSDLLAVLLKATALEPQARYSSAAALLEDIHRYQRGYAVSAHLPSRWHRLKKLIRRRPATSIAMATISIASLIFVALLFVQERRVSAQRAVAVQQAQSAESMVQYLESLLDASIQDRGEAGQKTTVYQMLLNSDADLPQRFADQPIVKERLHRQHATSFLAVQDYQKSASNAEAAIRAYEEAPSGAIAPRSLAESHYLLGIVQARMGDGAAGLLSHQKAIAIVRSSDVPDAAYLAELELELGVHYLTSQRSARLALPHIQSAATFFKAELTRQSERVTRLDYAYVLRQRAVAFLMNQQYVQALEDINTSIELIKAQWGGIEDSDVMLREKGRILALLGKPDEARNLLQTAYVDITTNAPPVQHASIRMLYGQAELLAGEYEFAVELLTQSLAGWIEHYGANMVAVASTQYLLAKAKAGAGDLKGAQREAEEALERGIMQFGEQDLRVADFMILAADLEADRARRLDLYRQASAIRELQLVAGDWRLAEGKILILLAEYRLTKGSSARFTKLKSEVTILLEAVATQEGTVSQQRGAQLQQRLESFSPKTEGSQT